MIASDLVFPYIRIRRTEFISYNTLRRVLCIVKSPKKTSTKTLDILSRFNDYKDYGHFLKSFKLKINEAERLV